jgi:FSR family fosmidomycin resistance protein-like MFS transporter
LRKFFVLAPTVTAIAMSLLGVAPTYAVMAMLLVIAGVSSAALHAAGPAVVGKLSGPKLGKGMGFWMVGGELGRALGPLSIVTAVQFLGLKGTPWLLIGGPVASLLLYRILKNVPDIVTNAGQKVTREELLRGWGKMILPLIGVVLVRSFLVASLSTYLPVLLTEQGSSLWLAGASLSVFEAAGVVGALVAGSWSDRMDRRLVLAIAMAITPIFMFIFLRTSGWAQFPMLILLGFAALSIMPVFMAVMQERFPQNRAFATGVFLALSFVIRSGVVVILGAIADRWDMHMAFTVSAAVALIGMPLIFTLPTKAEPAEA